MRNATLTNVYRSMWLTYGIVPLVAGLDKFFNLLVDWEKYLAPVAVDLLPLGPQVFMWIVGVIEIVVGLAILTKFTRLFAYVVMAWLTAIAINLILGGYYDIAVRDLSMAVGAYALGQVAAMCGEPWLPGVESSQPEVRHAAAT